MLNRIVRCTKDGIEYEADARQTEQFVRDLGMGGGKRVGTPEVKATPEQTAADQELAIERQRPYRGVAARSNYLPGSGQTCNTQQTKCVGGCRRLQKWPC